MNENARNLSKDSFAENSDEKEIYGGFRVLGNMVTQLVT